jgi:hypothetical protein
MQTPFLLYKTSNNEIKVDVLLKDETLWLSQKQIGELFSVQRPAITKHIKNIYESGELEKNSVSSIMEHTAQDNKIYKTNFYNLDMIIAVGYRVNSKQATHFRIWATNVLKEYIIKGFALNDDRFKSGNSMTYFDELQSRIRDIRISERFFYQKIKDIYTTSIDYDPKDEKTIAFFKVVQNKLLWAISSQTAAELIHNRVDVSLPFLGMQSFDKKSVEDIRKKDVSIAKNYLNEKEIKLLGLLVEQYLAFAETMAEQQTPMYMSDWIQRLDAIISLNGRELLNNAGKISHDMAMAKSALVYETYKEAQLEEHRITNLLELEKDIKNLRQETFGG